MENKLWKAALFYKSLIVAIVRPNDTTLGILNEINDLKLLRCVREPGLDLSQSIGYVITLMIDGIVDVPDEANRV